MVGSWSTHVITMNVTQWVNTSTGNVHYFIKLGSSLTAFNHHQLTNNSYTGTVHTYAHNGVIYTIAMTHTIASNYTKISEPGINFPSTMPSASCSLEIKFCFAELFFCPILLSFWKVLQFWVWECNWMQEKLLEWLQDRQRWKLFGDE